MEDIHLRTKPPEMAETLNPLAPSTNYAPAPQGLVNKLRSRFGRSPPSSRPIGEGYVEFGEFRAERPSIKKVGTFAGVFCPVVLSMFSALIFIRMGYLVGNAGLLVTLAQFGLAYLIVVFTVMSICAISTNGAVEGGGVYFMISRTLGPEFGGAIGTLFFFANVVSSALCISACTEALVENFGPNGYLIATGQPGLPDGYWYRFLYRSILNAIGVGVSLAGASLFARTSLAIWVTMLVCLSSALLSFFITPPGEGVSTQISVSFRSILNAIGVGVSLAGASLFARTILAIWVTMLVCLSSALLSFFITAPGEGVSTQISVSFRSILNAIGVGVSLAGASLFARTILAIWVTMLVCLSSALLSFFITPPGEGGSISQISVSFRSILNAIGVGVSLAGASLFARTSLAIWVTMLVCLSSALLSFFITPPGEGGSISQISVSFRSILNAIGVGVSLAGASLFARTSLAIWVTMLVCLSSALLSFFMPPPGEFERPDTNHLINTPSFNYTGLSGATLRSNLYPHYGRDYSTADGEMVDFASVFGVLFTGVTGVMAGANMSGELKNPASSIPRGTLAALLFTAISYVVLSVLTAATCTRELLQNNYVYLLPANVWPPFIAVGMLMATFSAGLSNLIGASRVLEALAKDNIYGFLLRPMVSRSGNPVLAVIASWLLVQVGIITGSLNTIAQINSVLFMTSYFAINLACLGLDLAGAPNFRPTFKQFSWATCVGGLAGCAGVMFALRPAHAAAAALAAAALVLALHALSPAAAQPTWGSLSQALIFHQVRKYLLLLDPRREHVKFWRPQMLLLIASPRQQAPLIDFVNDQKKGGLFVVGHVRVGELDGSGDPLAEEHKYWLKLIDHLKVKAFVELCLAESVRSGAAHLTRLSGLGAMKPDTVLLGFRDNAPPRDFFRDPTSPYFTTEFDTEAGDVFPLRRGAHALPAPEYVRAVADVLSVGKNVCLCRHYHRLDMAAVERKCPTLKYIDVWLVEPLSPRHGAFTVRALFALQLSAVVRSARGWRHLRLRVFCKPEPPQGVTEAGRTVALGEDTALDPSVLNLSPGRPVEHRLDQLLQLLRIDATVHVVSEWPAIENTSRWTTDSTDDNSLYQRVPISYLQKVNQVIKSRSGDWTAVTFVQLPEPPKLSARLTDADKAVCETYLQVLDEFTKDLSPTILVRGLKPVTSTAL